MNLTCRLAVGVVSFMRFHSLGIMLKHLFNLFESGQAVPAPIAYPERYFVAPTIWSKMPPSAKWVFCAFCQPPKA